MFLYTFVYFWYADKAKKHDQTTSSISQDNSIKVDDNVVFEYRGRKKQSCLPLYYYKSCYSDCNYKAEYIAVLKSQRDFFLFQ